MSTKKADKKKQGKESPSNKEVEEDEDRQNEDRDDEDSDHNEEQESKRHSPVTEKLKGKEHGSDEEHKEKDKKEKVHKDKEVKDKNHKDKEVKDKDHKEKGEKDKDHKEKGEKDKDHKEKGEKDKDHKGKDKKDKDHKAKEHDEDDGKNSERGKDSHKVKGEKGGKEELKVGDKKKKKKVVKTDEELEEEHITKLKEAMSALNEKEDPPKEKDELIDYLITRLEKAEFAIESANECIDIERLSRKKLQRELNDKTTEIKGIVEAEKKTIQSKVHTELEVTLRKATTSQMKSEEKATSATERSKEYQLLIDELTSQNEQMRQETKRLMDVEANLLDQLQTQANSLNYVSERRDEAETQIVSLNEQLNSMRFELENALGTISKLEDAKNTLNRLLGPNGVLSDMEKQKYLKTSELAVISPTGASKQGYGVQNDEKSKMPTTNASAVGKNMYQNNNSYFYQDAPSGGASPIKPNQLISKKAQGNKKNLLEEAQDDDFWYSGDGQKGQGEDGAMGKDVLDYDKRMLQETAPFIASGVVASTEKNKSKKPADNQLNTSATYNAKNNVGGNKKQRY